MIRASTGLATIALALIPLLAPAQEKRFEPAKCFPLECMAYLHVPSGAALLRTLGETLPGRIARDPEVRAALGRLPEMAQGITHAFAMPVQEATGKDVAGLLALLEGELALSVTGIDPVSIVGVAAAVELGANREAILSVLERLSAHIASSGGQVSTLEVGKRKAAAWRLPGLPPVHHLVLGTHLVLATSPDTLRSIAEGFDGAPGSEDFALAANPRFAEAMAGLKLEAPRLLLFANVEVLRGTAMTFLARDEGSKEIVKALQASGLTSITLLGYALGARAGDIEGKMLVGTGGQPRGLLKDFLDSLEAPGDLSAAFPLLPASVSSVGAAGIQPGKAFRALDRFLRQGLPVEMAHEVDGAIRQIQDRSGISFERDLFPLGKLDLLLATADPPAGGLIPDGLLLVRTEAWAPYRAVLEKLAKALKEEPRQLEGPARAGSAAARIGWLRIGSILSRLGLFEEPPPPEGLPLALLQPPIALAWTDLEGGWTILAASPQPIWRYVSARKGPPPAILERLRGLAGADAAVTMEPSRALLAAYNTLASLAGSFGAFIDPVLEPHEVDLQLLPPGEKFLGALGPSFLRVDTGPEGLSIHGHRILSSNGFLVLLVAAGAAAATVGFTSSAWGG